MAPSSDPNSPGPVLYAAPHSPWRSDGGLWRSQIPVQAAFLASEGVDGVFVGGSTGEWSSLSSRERIQLAEAWVPAAAEAGLELVVHVGHTSLSEARELARQAAACGAPAIAALVTGYQAPARLEDLVGACVEIAAAAPELPFSYYDIPALTGVRFPMHRFLELAGERLPSLASLKFTQLDLEDLQLCLEAAEGRWQVLFGHDEALLAGLALGVHGAIGSSYNFAAPLARELMRAHAAGDLVAARTAQRGLLKRIRLLAGFGYLPAAKQVMAWRGVDCGRPLPPLEPLGEAACARLRAEWEALGPLPQPTSDSLEAADQGL